MATDTNYDTEKIEGFENYRFRLVDYSDDTEQNTLTEQDWEETSIDDLYGPVSDDAGVVDRPPSDNTDNSSKIGENNSIKPRTTKESSEVVRTRGDKNTETNDPRIGTGYRYTGNPSGYPNHGIKKGSDYEFGKSNIKYKYKVSPSKFMSLTSGTTILDVALKLNPSQIGNIVPELPMWSRHYELHNHLCKATGMPSTHEQAKLKNKKANGEKLFENPNGDYWGNWPFCGSGLMFCMSQSGGNKWGLTPVASSGNWDNRIDLNFKSKDINTIKSQLAEASKWNGAVFQYQKDNGASHIGLILKIDVDNGILYCLEFNTSDNGIRVPWNGGSADERNGGFLGFTSRIMWGSQSSEMEKFNQRNYKRWTLGDLSSARNGRYCPNGLADGPQTQFVDELLSRINNVNDKSVVSVGGLTSIIPFCT